MMLGKPPFRLTLSSVVKLDIIHTTYRILLRAQSNVSRKKRLEAGAVSSCTVGVFIIQKHAHAPNDLYVDYII